MSKRPVIFESLDAADEALGATCERALEQSGGYHWWHIDQEAEEDDLEEKRLLEVVHCICKSCGTTMLLNANAEEYPEV